ncbi:hypothetical protein GCM10007199_30230 [Fictibacillus barbaricus]|nr:hypothetical protein GCM10007199_30230 [Fictibacillus barbaricus]
MSLIDVDHWVVMLSLILIILCFYFTLTFFHYLKLGDERMIKQSKLAAVICLALSFLIPVINSL